MILPFIASLTLLMQFDKGGRTSFKLASTLYATDKHTLFIFLLYKKIKNIDRAQNFQVRYN